ncbi:hypothetical protein Ddye_020634 [Dipteronia dyeriana]|uniref:DUF1985 domain-containing protein n=1 Tax=Dipteronia dyeriana TaxID=168575 RepID=A0AAD9U155_9ROSI|nr:hypothetical protein Ddye_020634 [Dipteronia dyeriana]
MVNDTKEMRSRLKDFFKTPEGDWFKGKLARHDHFESLAPINDALNRVPEDFAAEDRCRFMASCFGHFMSMHQEMKFSDGVIHWLLLQELDHDGPTYEMQLLLGNHVVRFSKVEFCLITELHFGVILDTSLEFQEAYDAMKLCLMYILNWILMGVDERFKIQVWQFRLVDDLTAFDAFPWGAHVYRHSILSFKHALPQRHEERRQQSQGVVVHIVEGYNIFGLSHALLTTTGKNSEEGSDEEGGDERSIETEASDPSGLGFSGMTLMDMSHLLDE